MDIAVLNRCQTALLKSFLTHSRGATVIYLCCFLRLGWPYKMWKYDFFSDGKISMNVKRRWIIVFWTFSSIKLFIYAEINGTPFWSKVEILLQTAQIYYERSRFYYERSRYIMKGRDLIMKGRDFIMNCRDFWNDRSRSSCWKVEIFMMADQDSYGDRLRFWW